MLAKYLVKILRNCTQKQPKSIVKLKNYTSWLSDITGTDESLLKDQFSSRKMVGKYLCKSFEDLISSAPENIKIYQHHEEVVNITENEDNHKCDDCRRSKLTFVNVFISIVTRDLCLQLQRDSCSTAYSPHFYAFSITNNRSCHKLQLSVL